MKKAAIAAVLLICGAGYVYMQTTAVERPLAAWMPGGALLYLEAPDFSTLLREWDASQTKSDWLSSANYAVFSRSNLFFKLNEVYTQYATAAGFEPGLKSIEAMAGDRSALALYDVRGVEFLYVTRLAESALAQTELWALRDKFQQRQAAGVPFYVRTDPASNRTVAFAFARGHLFLATRDDLVAQALELLGGAANPSIASDRWYRQAASAAPKAGELRLVMNLESLVKSTYFRSYWIQRNASAVRRYWTGISDMRRSSEGIVESRTFLRSPDDASAAGADVAGLLALVPTDAGMYKVWRPENAAEAAGLAVAKLIGAQPQRVTDWRMAPWAVAVDAHAGTEADLETRIDEDALPADPGLADAVAAITKTLGANRPAGILLVQSSALAGGPFIQTPAVLVFEGAADWDRGAVQSAVSTAAGKLWTTAQLGAGWTAGTAGSHAVDRLNGLATLFVTVRGPRLFLANDSAILAAVLDRTAARPVAGPLSYAAGFRLARERDDYNRIMRALDFGSPSGMPFGVAPRDAVPPLFSGNLASLGQVFSNISEMGITVHESADRTTQSVTYR